MADFNPAQYLAEKTKQQPQAFDPKKYLAEKNVDAPQDQSILDKEIPIIGGTGRGYTKGLLSSLPMVGMLTGGAIGTIGEPGLGTVAGAGLGSVAGENLKKLGEKYILGEEPESRSKFYGDLGTAGIEGATAEAGGQVLGAGVKAAVNTPLGQKALSGAGKGLAKIGETFSGVPQKEIETYAKNAEDIKSMAKASDNSTAEAADQLRSKFDEIIQAFKSGKNDEINEAIKGVSSRQDVGPIVNALEKEKLKYNPKANPEAISGINKLIERVKAHTPGEVPFEGSMPYKVGGTGPSEYGPVKETQSNTGPYDFSKNRGYAPESYGPAGGPKEAYSPMEAFKGEKKPKRMQFGPEGYGDRVKTDNSLGTGSGGYTAKRNPMTGPSGYGPEVTSSEAVGSGSYVPKKTIDNTVDATDLNRIKGLLQDVAQPAYGKPGEIFNESTPAQRAAKSGAATARGLLEDLSPGVKDANAKLSRLHELDDLMNSNLVKEGKPEAALLAAGSGGNPRNAKILEELGELTGHNMQGDAEKLAAMRTFGSPKLMAQDTTGKAAGRIGMASGIGYLLGNVPGAVGAGLLTSPAAVKVAIDGGILTKEALRNPKVQAMMSKGLLNQAQGMLDAKDGEEQSPEQEPIMLKKALNWVKTREAEKK